MAIKSDLTKNIELVNEVVGQINELYQVLDNYHRMFNNRGEVDHAALELGAAKLVLLTQQYQRRVVNLGRSVRVGFQRKPQVQA